MKKKSITLFSLFLFLFMATPALSFASSHGQGHGGEGSGMTHRMMLLMIQFGVIIFAAKMTGIAFSKLKLPSVLGELLSGMLLGAYALGGISFWGFPDGLFPMFGSSPVSPELYGIATVASVILLFDVGLETDLKMLVRYFFAGSLVGIGGVAASFFLGALVGYHFAPALGYNPTSLFDPMCMFLGIASTATSVGITARILSEKRQLDSPEGVTILSAAVIDDVIGIILLAVVTGISAVHATGGGAPNWNHIGMIGLKAISVWLVATIIGIAASRHISFLLKLFGERTSISVMAFGLALVLAGLFEEAGLAMIIGAYVMGLSLSKSDIAYVIREKLHTIYALMVPVFFCVTGMLINLRAMADTQVLLFAGIYTVTAFGAKVLGCGLPALVANFNLRGALRVGVGMAPRGEVGLIIAALGISAGILSDKLFAAIIIMVVVNTVIAPPILVSLFKNKSSGVRKTVNARSDEKELCFTFGGFSMLELFVSKLTEVFDTEGFYTHLLNRRVRLYQARKDDIVFEYQQVGTTLKFSCQETDVRFVHTAMLDAAASVEKAVKSLKKPLNGAELHATITSESGLIPIAKTKKVAQFLKPHYVKTGLQAKDKQGVIQELLTFLCDTGQLPRRCFDDVLKAIHERETCMSTGFSGGLAIPHAKVNCIESLACVVGVYKNGIPFDALDDNLSNVFVLTLSPTNKPTPHLEFISHITGAFEKVGLKNIVGTTSSEKIFELLVS